MCTTRQAPVNVGEALAAVRAWLAYLNGLDAADCLARCRRSACGNWPSRRCWLFNSASNGYPS